MEAVQLGREVQIARRQLVRVAAGLGGLSLLSACAPTAAPAPTAKPAAPTAAAAQPQAAPPATAKPAAAPAQPQPKRGGTLRTAIPSDSAVKADPHSTTPEFQSSMLPLVWDRLTTYDDKLTVMPQLIESWDMATDARSLKLNVRKGVQWHSGRTFTSDDVKFNLTRAKDAKAAPQAAGMAAWIRSIETPDANTALITFERPSPTIFDLFDIFHIADRQAIESPSPQATGSGPYKLTSWQPGSRMTFNRFADHWQADRAYLEEIVINVAPDTQAMTLQMEAGALDMVTQPALVDVARLGKNPAYRVIQSAAPGYFMLAFNTPEGPVDNKLVRQALNHAIDRKRFVDSQLYGLSDVTAIPWPPHSPAFDPAKAKSMEFDLDKAKSLLAQAGRTSFTLDFVYGVGPEYQFFAQMWQSDLAKIGVSVAPRPLPLAGVLDELGKFNFHAGGLPGQKSGLQPSSMFVLSSFWRQRARFEHPRWKELIDLAAVEPSEAKRREVYAELNNILLDESPYIVFGTNPLVNVARSNVNGGRVDLSGTRVFTDMWLS
jgi:peptide/nickel transport system substrate-binding protein